MKKTAVFILAALMLALSGCGKSVSYLGKPSFQYNDSTDDYSLFFSLADNGKNEMSADADVDIRIVNDDGETVYSGSKYVTTDDFGVYSSKIMGEALLANVRIKSEEIAEGTSEDGKVYFTVHKDGDFEFEEISCSALNCLPVKDVKVVSELPCEIAVKDYGGGLQSKILIESVEYEFDKGIKWLNISISGQKTYYKKSERLSSNDIITYKIFDSNGYKVDSGSIYLDDLDVGDKFKNDSIKMSDAKPGETYTVKFFEYER